MQRWTVGVVGYPIHEIAAPNVRAAAKKYLEIMRPGKGLYVVKVARAGGTKVEKVQLHWSCPFFRARG